MDMNKLLGWTWGEDATHTHLGFPISLSPRQREVLILLCEGLPNKLIGRRLGLSDATVKCHVASILRSLNVGSRLEAVAVAIHIGLVRPCLAERALKPAGGLPRVRTFGLLDAALAA
jgi:DNA-binding NarL/FixJ family response regulator